jgi:hypothetical protein
MVEYELKHEAATELGIVNVVLRTDVYWYLSLHKTAGLKA